MDDMEAASLEGRLLFCFTLKVFKDWRERSMKVLDVQDRFSLSPVQRENWDREEFLHCGTMVVLYLRAAETPPLTAVRSASHLRE